MAEDLEGRGKISALLRWGSALAGVLMGLGLAAERVLGPGLGRALMTAGMLTLTAVPVLRVAMLAGIFGIRGERGMQAVSLGVLAMMAAALWGVLRFH